MNSNRKAKVVDFTKIEIYPDKYQAKKTKTGFAFQIRSIIIEHIEMQSEQLISIGEQLFIGDYIKVDTWFGHYTGHPSQPEDPQLWESFPLKGELKVQQIIPQPDSDQIRLIIRPFLFRS